MSKHVGLRSGAWKIYDSKTKTCGSALHLIQLFSTLLITIQQEGCTYHWSFYTLEDWSSIFRGAEQHFNLVAIDCNANINLTSLKYSCCYKIERVKITWGQLWFNTLLITIQQEGCTYHWSFYTSEDWSSIFRGAEHNFNLAMQISILKYSCCYQLTGWK